MSLNYGQSTFADVEQGLKDWLRGLDLPNLGDQVYQGLPLQGPSSFPAVALYRVGGGPPDEADYPIDNAHVQIDVWGNKGQKGICLGVTQAIVAALKNLVCGTLLNEDVRALAANGFGVMYLPDKDSGRSRYIVTCVVQVQAV
jgi:hypothetical protein